MPAQIIQKTPIQLLKSMMLAILLFASASEALETEPSPTEIKHKVDERIANIHWIDTHFDQAARDLAKNPKRREAIIKELNAQVIAKAKPENTTEEAALAANFFVDYEVALEALALRAEEHELKESSCRDLRLDLAAAESGAENQPEDGLVHYSPSSREVLKLVDIICPVSPSKPNPLKD